MGKCSKCNSDVLVKELITCSICKASLHYWCGGKSEENFKKLGRAKLSWKCTTCKGSMGGEDDDGDEETKTSDGKLLDTMQTMFKQLSTDINSKLKDFEKSLQYSSSKLDDVLNGFDEMKKSFSSLQKKHDELTQENLVLKKTVNELSFQVHNMDQRMLDHNLVISGVPDSIVDPQVIVGSLCKKINVPCPDATSYVVKRETMGAPGKPKPIVAIFTLKKQRDLILKECKRAKPKVSDITNTPSDVQPVFVNEQLSPFMKQLFFNANKMKKEKGFAYLWVSEGRILLKKTNDSRTVRIQCLEDVTKP